MDYNELLIKNLQGSTSSALLSLFNTIRTVGITILCYVTFENIYGWKRTHLFSDINGTTNAPDKKISRWTQWNIVLMLLTGALSIIIIYDGASFGSLFVTASLNIWISIIHLTQNASLFAMFFTLTGREPIKEIHVGNSKISRYTLWLIFFCVFCGCAFIILVEAYTRIDSSIYNSSLKPIVNDYVTSLIAPIISSGLHTVFSFVFVIISYRLDILSNLNGRDQFRFQRQLKFSFTFLIFIFLLLACYKQNSKRLELERRILSAPKNTIGSLVLIPSSTPY